MLAVDFPQANDTLTKPDSMSDEQVAGMRVRWFMHTDKYGRQIPCAASCWMPNKEEIEDIIAGRPIYMIAQGIHLEQKEFKKGRVISKKKMFVSPVMMSTENPFVG